MSVIVTAYNQAGYLVDALASVAAQTHRPIECIVVDDGSTDETPDVIRKFEAQHGADVRIHSIRQRNQGAQSARNGGVRASHGEFIQYLDGDDMLDAKKVQAQVAMFSSPGGAAWDVLYGDARWLVEKGNEFRVAREIILGPTTDIISSLLGPRWNPPFSFLFRRAAVEKSGPWDPALRIKQDVEYLLRLACGGGRFGYAPIPTGLYRKHSGARISEGSMKLRSRTMLEVLKGVEGVATRAGTLTPARQCAFADAYRRVSYWSYGLDRAVWQESLQNFLRLAPHLPPETRIARCLQPILGVWRSEAVLGNLRNWKRQALERLPGAIGSFMMTSPTHRT